MGEPKTGMNPNTTSAPAHQPPDLSSLCLAITEHSPLPTAAVEGAGHVVRHVNRAFCRLMEKPAEQLVGKPFCELLPEMHDCVPLLDRVFRTGKPESHTQQEDSKPHPLFWSYTVWPVLTDDRIVGVMIQVTETAQFHGQMVAMNEALMLGSLRQHELTDVSEMLNVQLRTEISERSRMERTLQEQAETLADLARRKDEFLAMLSHELRNPLAPISNAVHLMRLLKYEDPLQQKARNIIERQVGQLKHLVDDLLEVSRITSGRVQLRPERIAVSGIVERALETARPLLDQRKHELTTSLPQQPVWLHADAARLEQVVVNLLTNAAKYTDEGGHIWLTVQQEGDAVVLRVRDTGIGIAPELLPRIFDLFTQAERSLDRSQGGLGIGLCLVRRLVDLHGGTVKAHSVVGQGSEFVVRLPVMLTSTPPSPSRSIETAPPSGKLCGVLVVDDNVDAAQSLAMLLEMLGHEVRMAYDGPTALEAAFNHRLDMVLLDIGLPGLNGFEVAKRIRQQPTHKDIVLVAMTGYGQEADRKRSYEAGFDHHLAKPVDFGELQKILATVSEKATVTPTD